MNGNRADDLDDEAFRARLAPLTAEVLAAADRRRPPGATWPTARAETSAEALAAVRVSPRGRHLLLVVPSATEPAPEDLKPEPVADVSVPGVISPFGVPPIGIALIGIAMAAALAVGVWFFAGAPTSEMLSETKFGPAASAPPVQPPSVPVPAVDMVRLLRQRGGDSLAAGDIIAARLLFERAAALGSAAAATEAGKTYDAAFLTKEGARGIPPDPTAAAAWFRKATTLGDPEAQALLSGLESPRRP